MKIGYLQIMKPMQKPSVGYVVAAWQRRPWWSWGLWWHPVQEQAHRVWRIGGWRRTVIVSLGRFGQLHFQHQY